jgi:hypothetical protein
MSIGTFATRDILNSSKFGILNTISNRIKSKKERSVVKCGRYFCVDLNISNSRTRNAKGKTKKATNTATSNHLHIMCYKQ